MYEYLDAGRLALRMTDRLFLFFTSCAKTETDTERILVKDVLLV